MIGENGTGKKSFINTLCEKPVYQIQDHVANDDIFRIVTDEVIIRREFPIRMNIHRTCNFGFGCDNSRTSTELANFLDDKFERKFNDETRIDRSKKSPEEIVHLVILLINPTSTGLKPLEIDVIKKIEKKCNLMICIAKSDLLNQDEILQQKSIINNSLFNNGLEIFGFDQYTMGDEVDMELKEYYQEIKAMVPFSIITSNTPNFECRNKLGKSIDINRYCDLQAIKEFLFDVNLLEFKEITANSIYENYRTERLLLN